MTCHPPPPPIPIAQSKQKQFIYYTNTTSNYLHNIGIFWGTLTYLYINSTYPRCSVSTNIWWLYKYHKQFTVCIKLTSGSLWPTCLSTPQTQAVQGKQTHQVVYKYHRQFTYTAVSKKGIYHSNQYLIVWILHITELQLLEATYSSKSLSVILLSSDIN